VRESRNWDNIEEKAEEKVVLVNGAKIHRANILARVIHCLSLYRMEWSFERIRN
jgi:hypothetical protein